MGATSFHVSGTGPSARHVFDQLVLAARAEVDDEDQDWCSDIGDKTSFTMIPLPDGVYEDDRRQVADAADTLIAANDPRVDDKFGPAGCFDLGSDHPGLTPGHSLYLFFGWAPE